MDKIAKEVWCAALRSGEFEQDVGCLAPPDGGFCCLGVAMKVFPALEDTFEQSITKWPLCHYLTPGACALLGLSHDTMFQLASLNDSGRSFKEIAAVIEEFA